MAVLILYLLLAIIIYLIYLIERRFRYWSRKGVKFIRPLPIIGNYGDVIFSKKSNDDFLQYIYEQFPEEKVVGFYRGMTPVALVRDPEIIKQILIKDFNLFSGRGINKLQSGKSGLGSNLFLVDGEMWKVLRYKMTPSFTSKKIKDMLPIIKTCLGKLTNYTEDAIGLKSDFEMRSLMSKYSLDVIGSSFFGLDVRAYDSDTNILSEVSRQITRPEKSLRLSYMMDFIIPGFHDALPQLIPTGKYLNFFLNILHDLKQEREENKLIRNDLMDTLLELRKIRKVSIRNENGHSETDICDVVLAAQIFAFFVAGLESTSATLSYLFYNLATHQDIQERVYKEICEVYDKYNGELVYESINDLTYLKMAINETIRMHTPLGSLSRESLSEYTLPGINITIEKGTPVLMSTSGIHYDSKYYPNPKVFNPDNFSSENINNLPQCSFLPFGAGPRQCIAMRFASTQMFIAAATYIKTFKMDVCSKTKTNIEYDPKSFSKLAKDGAWVKISKRK